MFVPRVVLLDFPAIKAKDVAGHLKQGTIKSIDSLLETNSYVDLRGKNHRLNW